MCERCKRVRALVTEWCTKTGDESCWYYPEIFREIAAAVNIEVSLVEPGMPRTTYRANCHRFEAEIYDKNATLQKRVDVLTKRVKELEEGLREESNRNPLVGGHPGTVDVI